jgi:quercetin 2,3-dioxygenase
MEDHSRRSFFKKLTTGLAAGVGATSGIHALANQIKMESNTIPTIIETKPMGFIWDTIDPFLFCVHHEDKFPVGNTDMGPDKSYLSGRHMGEDFIIKDGFRMYHGRTVPGFPGHPHRGFETVTVVREGVVDHSDSMGASGRYGEGDVQWMTAGSGIQHAEMFPLIHDDKPNPMELFQIWLNLPKKSKMVAPHFKMLWGKDIPKHTASGVEVEVIAGSLQGHTPPTPPPNSWAADSSHQVGIMNIRLEARARFTLPKAANGVNRMLYFYIGEQITIAGTSIKKYHSIKVQGDHDIDIVNGDSISKVFVLQGMPINEPVIQYGPFVMNTKEEINQAFADYNTTQFGGWPWPKYDVVHDRRLGRFAKHADGRVEEGA